MALTKVKFLLLIQLDDIKKINLNHYYNIGMQKSIKAHKVKFWLLNSLYNKGKNKYWWTCIIHLVTHSLIIANQNSIQCYS